MAGTFLYGFTAPGVAVAGQFDDVPPPPWAVTYIDTVTADGVMEGCGGPFFCPDEDVTREDMAIWLERGMRGAGYIPPAAKGLFGDVPASYCLAPWIEQFANDGISAGCSAEPKLYCPYRPLSRAEMAVFLLKAEHGASYQPPACTGIFTDVACPGGFAVNWIEQLYREGITAGCSASPPLFCPDAQVTRAEMAVFLVRTFKLQ
jgi:hypothetical protein